MAKSGLIVFDLDDTLLNTSNVYWLARKLFVEKLSEELQINEDKLIEEFEQVLKETAIDCELFYNRNSYKTDETKLICKS